MTNNSDISRAVWLDDNTAVLAPFTAPSIGYRAKALGVRASCRSVTDQCVRCNSTTPNTIVKCDGPLAGPTLLCQESAGVNVTAYMNDYSPSGPIALNGSEIYHDFTKWVFGSRACGPD
jgi:hypothetical protein